MSKILITGKNSFIGTFFIFQAKQHEINEVCLIKNKVSDIDFSGYDVVLHLAAIVHQDKAISDETYFAINSELAFQVAKKAKNDGVKQFIFMSTVKVYGENSTWDAPWNEESECYPSDAYGKSKLSAEQRINELYDETFLVSIIRTPVVYGPNVKGNISKLMKIILKNKFIPLDGINNGRAMVFIGNLTALINKIIEKQKSGIYLAGDQKTLSTSEFVHIIAKQCPTKKYIFKFPAILITSIKLIKPEIYNRIFGSLIIDNSNSFKELNFTPPFSIEEGVKTILENFKF